VTNDPIGQLVTLQATERLLQRVLTRGVKPATRVVICQAIAQIDQNVTALIDSIGEG
jgi:hypothetical protein